MKKRINFNKKCRIDKVCGSDRFRPTFDLIYFEDGNMIATNGHVLMVLCLYECSTFCEQQINLLNGKYLHKKDYQSLLKEEVIVITEDGFLIKNDGREKTIKFVNPTIKFPDYKKLFDRKKGDVNAIGLSASMMNIIASAFPFDTIKLEFTSNREAIYISPARSEYESKGLIMPCLLD